MKKIIITITSSGLVVDANGVPLIAINPPEKVSQGFFLEVIKQEVFFCLN
jgi:hypothetical protein